MSTQSPAGVVVGYDGSPQADLALTWAVETAAETGRDLTILHVVPLEPVSSFPIGGPTGWDGDLHWGSLAGPAEAGEEPDPTLAARRHPGVEHARAVLGETRVHLASGVGNAAARLVDASGDAELVVIGSRGHGGVSALVLGSTAYAVTAHAHCPVVVVRAPETADRARHPGPEHPVVLGMDDVEASGAALEAAVRLAADHGAPLRIVKALAVPAFVPWLDDTMAYDDALRREADEVAQAAVQRVHESGPELECTAEVVQGRAGRVLAKESATAGMVVVGSRGRGGFRGLLLGSVSHGLLHEAHCPVMVVR